MLPLYYKVFAQISTFNLFIFRNILCQRMYVCQVDLPVAAAASVPVSSTFILASCTALDMYTVSLFCTIPVNPALNELNSTSHYTKIKLFHFMLLSMFAMFSVYTQGKSLRYI